MINSVNFRARNTQRTSRNNGNKNASNVNMERRRKQNAMVISSSDDSDDIPLISTEKDSTHIITVISSSSSSEEIENEEPAKVIDWSAPASERPRHLPKQPVADDDVRERNPRRRRRHRESSASSESDDGEDCKVRRRRRRRDNTSSEDEKEEDEKPHRRRRRRENVSDENEEVVHHRRKRTPRSYDNSEEEEAKKTRIKKKRTKKVSVEEEEEEEEQPKPKAVKKRKSEAPSLRKQLTKMPEEEGTEAVDFSSTKQFEIKRERKMFGKDTLGLIKDNKISLYIQYGKSVVGKGIHIVRNNEAKDNVGFLRFNSGKHKFSYYKIDDNGKYVEFFGVMYARHFEKPKPRKIVLVFTKDFSTFSPATKAEDLSIIAKSIIREDLKRAKEEIKKRKEEEKKKKDEKKKVFDNEEKEQSSSEANEEEDMDIYVEGVNRENFNIFYSELPVLNEVGGYEVKTGGVYCEKSKKTFLIKKNDSNKCFLFVFKVSSDMYKVMYDKSLDVDTAFSFAVTSIISK